MNLLKKHPTNSQLTCPAVEVADQFKPLLLAGHVKPVDLAWIAQQAINRSGAVDMLECLIAIRDCKTVVRGYSTEDFVKACIDKATNGTA